MATVTYSTADLQGTWQWHSLVAANNNNLASWSGWIHGIINLNASGNGTFSNVVKSDGTTIGITSVFISISSGGVITVGGDSYGYMSADKSSVYLTMTDGGGGYTLGVMQKVASAITYNLTDLQGTWQMHSLTTSNPSSSNQYASWMHGTISMDASGNGTANFVDVNGSKSQNMILSISSDGIVTMNGKDFHGFMSENKKSISITMTDGGGGGYDLISMQKDISGTSYATADLQGKWQTHVLSTSNLSIISLNQQPGWSHGIITLKSNGEGKTNFVNNNGKHSDNDITLSISSNGLVTTSGKDMHGFMSADKSSILMTMTEDNGGYTLAVMQKDLSVSGDFGLQVQFVDENNGWASIYNMIYGNFQLYKTTDGGSTWNPIDNAVGGIYQFVDANNGWMEGATIGNIGEGNLNNIYHTTDGGSIWIQQASNIGKANALYFSDLLHGWVVGENGLVLKTTDGGSNWTAVTNASITSVSNSKSVFFLDANNGWITNEEPSWPNHTILHTTNGGNSWTHQDPNFLNGSMFNIFFWDKNNGWFTGEQNIQNGFSQNSENEFRGIISHFAQNDVNITAGGLATSLSDTEKNTITNLIITGTIDARDFKTMRDDMPQLANIDLSGTMVTEYTGTTGTFYDASITTYPANTIPQRSFYYTATKTGKTSLKSFIFPASVTDIGTYAFRSSGLTSITTPSTVTSIGYGNFFNCINLTSVVIPSSVTTIGDYAFQNCASLSSVSLPSSVTTIGYAAFAYTGLKNLILADGISTIGDYAFQNCVSLSLASIPSTVTSIGNGAFNNCSSLKSVNFESPSQLNTIGVYAFGFCSELSSFEVPSLVTNIGDIAFLGSGISVTVNSNNTNFSALDGVMFNKDLTRLMYCPSKKNGSYTIPSSVTNIAVDAFYNCSGLNSITIPSSVTTLENWAFENCTGLSQISIPASVNSIGSYAFYNCSGLTSIYANVATPVDLSKSDSVFYNINMNACMLYVPSGSKSLYQAADKWKDFSNIIEKYPKSINVSAGGLYAALTSIELNTVTDLNISGQIDARDFRTMRDLMPLLANIDIRGVSIAEYTGTEGTSGSTSIKYWADNLPPDAFKNPVTYVGKQTLKSIILPSYLWAIGGAAFANSTLEKVVMPSTVYDIQSWSFSGTNISSIFIPASVKTIGSSAFGGTNKLPSIDVSSENQYFTSIDGVLFDKSGTKLLAYPSGKGQAYSIPTGVTSIEANAFQATNVLEELNIPSTVTKIGNSAFIWSWGLKKVNIPASVTTIEANVFNGCGSLSKIYVESSIPVDLSSSADVFLNVDKSSCILYVPVGYKAAYQAANQWSNFQNIVETGGSVTYNVTVPVGTKACYIAGEMSSWIHQIMTKLDDTHYTITIQNADISQEYKYCSGPSWDYLEMSATNDYFPNRSYSANDVVANWLAVFDPSKVTASDYYLPLCVGNYTKLHTNYIASNTNWCDRSTKYSFIRTETINNLPYYLEEGWEGDYLPGECLGANPIFRYLWLRKDEAGNIMLGATATNEDQYGNLSSDLSSAMILPEPMALFPNKFLRVNEFISYPQSETITDIDSVISVTATAGSYTNCIQVRSLHRTTGGIVNFIEDSYYAYHVGLVMQNRLLPVDQIHTNYITSYLADPSTGIKELKGSDFSVLLYPNPVTDGFYINAGEKATTVSIYNLSGVLTLTKQIAGKSYINISTLARSLYIVKITTSEGTVKQKLIKN
ncbi:MAG TPA: leucine-rich repeat protein [Paludibacter sp.]